MRVVFSSVGALSLLVLACGGLERTTLDVDAGVDASASAPDASAALDAGQLGALSYSRDIQPIWDRWCTRCHYGDQRPILTAPSYQNLSIGSALCFWNGPNGPEQVRMLEPGDPDKSAIVAVTSHDPLQTGCLTRMPRGSEGLSAESPADWELIRRWILAGAKDD